jgi:predicted 3-demethylubiquinone-9 3-methyltransferase (glyoxalase superfamily)
MARAKIVPHLWYAKEAEEAARFYASIFPDSGVDRVTPLRSESPSGPPGSVKVVDFTLFGQRFQAISAGPHHEFNDAISFVVLCDDQAETTATGTRSSRKGERRRPAAGSSTGSVCAGRLSRLCSTG